MSSSSHHIAVFRLSAMGDVAMTVPVLRALVQQYPDLKITVVSRPFFKPFFRDISNVDFLSFDAKNKHKGFIGIFKLFVTIKNQKINAFADLHHVLRSQIIRILCSLNGIKTAHVNKARAEKKALTRTENKVFQPLTSIFDRHAKVFSSLGFPVDLNHISFPAKPELQQSILEITGTKTEKKWIGIAPFAQYESKIYPLDLMAEVITTLSKNENCKILLFGGGQTEIEKLKIIENTNQNVINVAGKMDLNQELDLIANLDVMLSMDSGNAHIAAMLGIPVVTLWGATHPFAGFAPFNQPIENALTSDRILYPKLPTSIYGKKQVAGYENVMRTIDVATIVEKLIQFTK